MKNELDCEIIRDLMPSCADKIASEKSRAAVEKHIESCESCKKIFSAMKAPESRSEQNEGAEIDYLKKLKKSSKKKAVITAAVILFAVSLGLALRLFYPGRAVYYDDISADISLKNGKISYSLSSLNEKKYVTKVDVLEKNGEVLFTVFCAPKSPLGKKNFTGEYTLAQTADTGHCAIKVNGNTVFENGYYTDSTEYKLWKNKTPYCGSITDDCKIAEIVGVYSDLGSFTNELSTVSEPYKWRLFLKNEIKKEDEARCKKLMKSKACAILACIENLDKVTFVYKTNGEEKRFSVSSSSASHHIGSDIKTCTGTVEEIRKLLDRLEIE